MRPLSEREARFFARWPQLAMPIIGLVVYGGPCIALLVMRPEKAAESIPASIVFFGIGGLVSISCLYFIRLHFAARKQLFATRAES